MLTEKHKQENETLEKHRKSIQEYISEKFAKVLIKTATVSFHTNDESIVSVRVTPLGTVECSLLNHDYGRFISIKECPIDVIIEIIRKWDYVESALKKEVDRQEKEYAMIMNFSIDKQKTQMIL